MNSTTEEAHASEPNKSQTTLSSDLTNDNTLTSSSSAVHCFDVNATPPPPPSNSPCTVINNDGAKRLFTTQRVPESMSASGDSNSIQRRPPGLEFNANDIICLSELGRGNGGVVCKTQHRLTGFLMARKTFTLDIKTATRAQIFRDLQVLYDISSSFIVEFYGAFPMDDQISIYTEYMDAGGLDTLLPSVGRFPEPIIIQIAHDVVQGLLYLWEEVHVVHRNLKPSNVLLSRSGSVKLSDFVVSMPLVETLASAFVGMRTYMAPERLTGEPYNSPSDVWSLGLTLMELAIGHYPIPAMDPVDFVRAFAPDRESNMAEHWKAARTGEPLPALDEVSNRLMGVFELFAYVVEQPAPRLPAYCFSAGFIHLVHACLQKEPSDRLSIELLGNQILPPLLLFSITEEVPADQDSSTEDSSARVSVQGYLRGIFARQQAEAIDAVTLAVAEALDGDTGETVTRAAPRQSSMSNSGTCNQPTGGTHNIDKVMRLSDK